MPLLSRFRSLFAGSTRRPASGRKASPRRPVRLNLEALEDRTVPSVTFDSAFGVGNDMGSSQARDVAVDAAGNSYLTGSFTGTVDFDPARTHAGDADVLTARGGNDIFVAKYAPDNSLVWARRMGGDAVSTNGGFTDVGEEIEIDGNGNVYVTGGFKETADFGPVSLTSAGDWDGFVAKLNASGSVLWANRWGAGLEDVGKGVDTDAAGNVYVVGGRTYKDSSGLFSVHNNHGLDVLKFSPTGSAVWAKWVNTRSIPLSADLAVDTAGNVFVGGKFSGSVDLDPGSKTRYFSSGGSYSGFVLKLTSAGSYGWASTFYGQTVGSTSGYSAVQSIALDGGGNVIVGGWYRGPVDFNPGAGTTTLPTIGGAFITKLNSTGGLVWARALESASSTFVYGLAVDAAGGIYAAGTLFGTVDFDPGAGTHSRTTAGGSDAFVLKLDSAGNFGWAETFGSTGNDIGWGIAVDAAGTVYLAGAYQGNVDFDPDPMGTYVLTNAGSFYNLYHVRLRQS